MSNKYFLYALFVTVIATATSWLKLIGSSTHAGGGGSGWSSHAGGGGHK